MTILEIDIALKNAKSMWIYIKYSDSVTFYYVMIITINKILNCHIKKKKKIKRKTKGFIING